MAITANNEIIQTLISANKKQLIELCNFAKIDSTGTMAVLRNRLYDEDYTCFHWSKARGNIVPAKRPDFEKYWYNA